MPNGRSSFTTKATFLRYSRFTRVWRPPLFVGARICHSGQLACAITRKTHARRPAPANALPRKRRPCRARRARGALPAARAPARPPLPARQRAARRPDAGREHRPREGDRPLRPRARHRVLELRRADDPRRAEALLPRLRLGRARAARHAGARDDASNSAIEALTRELGRSPTAARGRAQELGRARRRCSRRWRPQSAYDAVSLDSRAPSDEDGGDTYADTIGDRRRALRAGGVHGRDRPDDAALPTRDRLVLQLRFEEDLTQSRSPSASASRRCTCRG